MKRAILGISLRDRVSNVRLCRMPVVNDAIERITTLKWNKAGHVARMGKANSGVETATRGFSEQRLPTNKMHRRYSKNGAKLDECSRVLRTLD